MKSNLLTWYHTVIMRMQKMVLSSDLLVHVDIVYLGNGQLNAPMDGIPARRRVLPGAKKTNVRQHFLGKMEIECSACTALHWKAEVVRNKTTFDDCCRHGRIELFPLGANYPILLQRLLLRQDQRWRHFLDRIRSFNSAVSFASVNCQREATCRQQNASVPYVFRIQGKVYSLINTGAHPPPGEERYGSRKYGQLYVIDPAEANRHRQEIHANDGLDFDLMGELDQMMRNVSPHAQAFDMLREMEEVERQRISDIGGAPAEIPEIQLVFRCLFFSFRRI